MCGTRTRSVRSTEPAPMVAAAEPAPKAPPAGLTLNGMGVRGRLVLAFMGISGFAVIAAVAGIFSLKQMGDALDQVTHRSVPEALVWLEISGRAGRIVRAAPTLMIVGSEGERQSVAAAISAEIAELDRRMREEVAVSETAPILNRLGPAVAAISANLVALDALVQERLVLEGRMADATRRLSTANNAVGRLFVPTIRQLDSQVIQWRRLEEGDELGEAELSGRAAALAREIATLAPQQQLAQQLAELHEALAKVPTAASRAEIDVLTIPVHQRLTDVSRRTEVLPAVIQQRLDRQLAIYAELARGEDSLAAIRLEELRVLAGAEDLLAENASAVGALETEVEALVEAAYAGILQSRAEADGTASFSAILMMSVVFLSLASSVLIIWLYVNRSLLARLTELSDSMLAIAGGNLRAPLPEASGDDEITRMAEALTVFRDTAVEVEEQNLREIARARQRLIDAIESISEGFAFFDADDRLELCNTRYRELVSDPKGNLIHIGMSLAEIAKATAATGVVTTGDASIDAYVNRRIDEHRAPGAPTLRRMGDGRWLQISERRIEGGGTVALYSDVTDIKRREAELADLVDQLGRAREEAERANEAKSAFLANVSHELRTPLTSILGFARIIQGRMTDRIIPAVSSTEPRVRRAVEQVTQNLAIILAEGQRLTALINNVLDLEKIASGGMEWESAQVSIAEVIERSSAATAALFAEKGLNFVLQVPPDLPSVRGDRDKLVQTMINLLANAVKFTERGSVTCRASVGEDEVMVSVIDTGVGIASEDQAKVFEKFRQVGDTLTEKPMGTGLGLAIAKEIIDHHGGRLWLESALGRGSTFSFALPVALRPLGAAAMTRARKLSREALLAALAHVDGRRRKGPATILIVDDDASIRQLLRQDLEAAGHRVIEATDGQRATELANARMPNLIVLDVLMPGGDGLEAAARLRLEPRTMGIPIVMLSVVAPQDQALRGRLDRWRSKPIDKDELLTDIAALLEAGVSRRRVLVVDPDPDTRAELADALEAAGHEARPASGLADLPASDACPPDLAIVTTGPAGTGVDAVRAAPGLADLPLIVLDHTSEDA